MARGKGGKHRVSTPVRLVAAAATVLAVSGIVVAAGTASADNDERSARRAAECESGQVVSLSDMLAKLRGQQSGRFAAFILSPGRDDGHGGPHDQERDGWGGAAGNDDADAQAVHYTQDTQYAPGAPDPQPVPDPGPAPVLQGDPGPQDAPDVQEVPDAQDAPDLQEAPDGQDTPDVQQAQGADRDGDQDDGADEGSRDESAGRQDCDRGNIAQEASVRQDDDKDGDRDRDGNRDQNDGGQNGDDEQFPGRDQAGGPFDNDFVEIEDVEPNVDEPEPGSDASVGTFVSVCGTNAEGHRNSDNFMVAPGKVNGAQHVHDYVGNLSTDAFSDDESLDAADTTCALNDKSTYFWPVLRDTDGRGEDADEDGGGLDGNVGEILQPAAVDLEFRGSPTDPVNAMPEGLAVITGDAKAKTNGDANAKAAWTCTGFEDRTTTKYPLCPQGSDLVRILDFPSCWDGDNLDSANHRDHIVFPDGDGSCDGDTVAVPQLRMTLTYDRPDGDAFALDSFPEQQHDPNTDHADFMNMMPDELMEQVVDCINSGKTC